MPVKQGMLFSDDEHNMDVDVQKTSGLMAEAKITLFEVEVFFKSTFFQPVDLYAVSRPNVRTLLPFEGAKNPERRRLPPCGSNESQTYHWVIWKPFQNGERRSWLTLSDVWYLMFLDTQHSTVFFNFSIYPPVMSTSTRMPSLTHLQKYSR